MRRIGKPRVRPADHRPRADTKPPNCSDPHGHLWSCIAVRHGDHDPGTGVDFAALVYRCDLCGAAAIRR